jgi:hypothetical protein
MMHGKWHITKKLDCRAVRRGSFGSKAEIGLTCRRHLKQRKLGKRRPITANGVQKEEASLQQQSVEYFKKNLVIPTQLMGKVCASFEQTRGLSLGNEVGC